MTWHITKQNCKIAKRISTPALLWTHEAKALAFCPHLPSARAQVQAVAGLGKRIPVRRTVQKNCGRVHAVGDPQLLHNFLFGLIYWYAIYTVALIVDQTFQDLILLSRISYLKVIFMNYCYVYE